MKKPRIGEVRRPARSAQLRSSHHDSISTENVPGGIPNPLIGLSPLVRLS